MEKEIIYKGSYVLCVGVRRFNMKKLLILPNYCTGSALFWSNSSKMATIYLNCHPKLMCKRILARIQENLEIFQLKNSQVISKISGGHQITDSQKKKKKTKWMQNNPLGVLILHSVWKEIDTKRNSWAKTKTKAPLSLEEQDTNYIVFLIRNNSVKRREIRTELN